MSLVIALIILVSLVSIVLSNTLVLSLIYLDLLLLSIGTLFIFFLCFYLSSLHYVFALLLLAIAAVETAIGLGLIVAFYQTTDHYGHNGLNNLYF